MFLRKYQGVIMMNKDEKIAEHIRGVKNDDNKTRYRKSNRYRGNGI